MNVFLTPMTVYHFFEEGQDISVLLLGRIIIEAFKIVLYLVCWKL